jgi:cell shape-determining protein MreC
VERVVARLRALHPLSVEELVMTEENYTDPGQNQPALVEQLQALLTRIGQLEAEVRELRDQLELAQGGRIVTYPS